MIFPQDKRFKIPEAGAYMGPSEVYIPHSMLSTHGTKIVDSWNSIGSPRLDHNLLLKDGFLIPCRREWQQNLSPIDLPPLDSTKPKKPSYSFPKDIRGSRVNHNSNLAPGAIYHIPSSIGNDIKKGASFGFGKKCSSVQDRSEEHTHATVLSLEQAKACETATKKVFPNYSFGLRTSYEDRHDNDTPGPGAYSAISDTMRNLGCGIKYAAPTSEKRKTSDSSSSSSGPGPGDYNVTQSLIKPSFNRGKRTPVLPYSEERVGVVASAPAAGAVSQPQSSIDLAAHRPPTSMNTKSNGPSLNRHRARKISTVVPMESHVTREILFKQRKHAASILQSLVVANQKQLSIPVRTILKALQQVLLFKALTIDQLQKFTYLLLEKSYKEGEYIIKQGDVGENFYILIDGQCACTINQPDGPERLVFVPNLYDYFGEKALLTSAPRAANVIARTDCKVLYIGKSSFEEVLGSLSDIIENDTKKRREQEPVEEPPAAVVTVAQATTVTQNDPEDIRSVDDPVIEASTVEIPEEGSTYTLAWEGDSASELQAHDVIDPSPDISFQSCENEVQAASNSIGERSVDYAIDMDWNVSVIDEVHE